MLRALAMLVLAALPALAATPTVAEVPYPPPAPPIEGTYLSWERLEWGLHSGYQWGWSTLHTRVVEDEGAWRALWAEHVAGRVPAQPPPAVDFERHFVVGMFYGRFAVGPAYEVTVHGVAYVPGQGYSVAYRTTEPYVGATLQWESAPYDLVAVPRQHQGSPQVAFLGCCYEAWSALGGERV